MLIGATCINLGEYAKGLQTYLSLEQEIQEIFSQPQLNLKLSSIFLNVGICYIYMGNPNLAERYLRKGLCLTDGMLGNEIVHKVIISIQLNLKFIFF
jgi:hypothetical protein